MPSSLYTLRRNPIILASMSNSMVVSLTGFSANLSAVTDMLFMFLLFLNRIECMNIAFIICIEIQM
ncbi:hypothetical protein Hanom_Chr03g00202601 [Helianthus anomalus]